MTDQTQIELNNLSIDELLAIRPITEDVMLLVDSYDAYKGMEIDTNGDWILSYSEDEYKTGEEHGRIESKLLYGMGSHVMVNDLGRVYPGDTSFIINTETGRRLKPDVAFVSKARVQATPGYIIGAPDLAVEIISPSQSPDELREKVAEYLQAGTQQVWLVFPRKKQVELYLADGSMMTYSAGQMLPGGTLLPGFELEVQSVFPTDAD